MICLTSQWYILRWKFWLVQVTLFSNPPFYLCYTIDTDYFLIRLSCPNSSVCQSLVLHFLSLWVSIFSLLPQGTDASKKSASMSTCRFVLSRVLWTRSLFLFPALDVAVLQNLPLKYLICSQTNFAALWATFQKASTSFILRFLSTTLSWSFVQVYFASVTKDFQTCDRS
jgi:hypothetical protein